MSARPHADLIKKWADNADAVVWQLNGFGSNEWVAIAPPYYWCSSTYAVILPEYAEAWQAYLDGALQDRFRGGGTWYDWKENADPAFNNPPECYRRKPAQLRYRFKTLDELRQTLLPGESVPFGVLCLLGEPCNTPDEYDSRFLMEMRNERAGSDE